MVTYTQEGANNINLLVSGKLMLTIVGEDLTPIADELSVVLTRCSYLTGSSCDWMFDGKRLGDSSAEDRRDLRVEAFKEFFGISLLLDGTLPDAAISSRNNGFVYEYNLGEPMLYSEVTDTYTLNDGAVIKGHLIDNALTIALKKDSMKTMMPILFEEHQRAEKEYKALCKQYGLGAISEGTKVQIRHWDDLVEEFGYKVIAIDDHDDVVFLDDAGDPESIKIIPSIGYTKLSADYYNGKIGVIKSVDVKNKVVILDIDGVTKHSKFIDLDGSEQDSMDAGVAFTLQMIKKPAKE
jgi:hypothetical protein